ncbi:hypothetical protein G6F68_020903 [Rhizopus microsporus]|nr:hypothetical protein G6F68_020903 [Rhizopus microsporus]
MPAYRGQRRPQAGGQRAVVIADDGQLTRNVDAGAQRHLVDAGGHFVVAGEDGGRATLAQQQFLGSGHAGFEGVARLDDAVLRQLDTAL